MPDTIQGSFQGTAAAFQNRLSNMGLLLLIAIIVVYIMLGILYESFIHPAHHPVGPAVGGGGRADDAVCCSACR